MPSSFSFLKAVFVSLYIFSQEMTSRRGDFPTVYSLRNYSFNQKLQTLSKDLLYKLDWK